MYSTRVGDPLAGKEFSKGGFLGLLSGLGRFLRHVQEDGVSILISPHKEKNVTMYLLPSKTSQISNCFAEFCLIVMFFVAADGLVAIGSFKPIDKFL